MCLNFKLHFLLYRYPQGTSLRVAPSNNDLNDPDISSKIEEGLGIAGDFQDDSSSYYDKSDKDSPLHGYDFKNMKDLNLREYPAGQRCAFKVIWIENRPL